MEGRLRAAASRSPIDAPTLPGRGTCPSIESKAYLAALGIAVPQGALARDPEAASEIAARIGYPVALKAQAAALAHKSDAGGVVLHIADAAALEAAWQRIAEHRRRAARPRARRHAGRGDGAARRRDDRRRQRDPGWGPVVLVGLGGIWTEALDDVRLMPADLARDRSCAEILALKGARLLRGLRGAAPVDIAAVADVVLRVGALMRARPEITEIDINPLIAYPDGVLALDALIVTA